MPLRLLNAKNHIEFEPTSTEGLSFVETNFFYQNLKGIIKFVAWNSRVLLYTLIKCLNFSSKIIGRRESIKVKYLNCLTNSKHHY